jgi:hypothetical protein
MNKRFTTYKEMLDEQQRLTALMRTQQLQIQQDITEIKVELEPVFHITASLKKFVTRKSGDILSNLGVKLLADGLVKKIILAKAGWLTRLVVPLLVKNYASHFANSSGSFIEKIKSLFSKNGKSDHSGIDAV